MPRSLSTALSALRFASSVSTASSRNEVAVGIERLSFIALASVAGGRSGGAGARGRGGGAPQGRGPAARGWGGRGAVAAREDVRLGDLAAVPAALDAGEVDAVRLCGAAGDRGGLVAVVMLDGFA